MDEAAALINVEEPDYSVDTYWSNSVSQSYVDSVESGDVRVVKL